MRYNDLKKGTKLLSDIIVKNNGQAMTEYILLATFVTVISGITAYLLLNPLLNYYRMIRFIIESPFP